MLVRLYSQYSSHSYILIIVVIVCAGYFQYSFRQPPDYGLCISVGDGKQRIVPIDIFACNSTVKFITPFDEAMETIHRVQIKKMRIIAFLVRAVPHRAVCDSGKCMVTP